MNPEITSTDNLDLKSLLSALVAFKKGNFSTRLPANLVGMEGKIADVFNDIVETAERMSEEMQRVSGLVGKEGKTSERASVSNARGGWQSLIASSNSLINDLVLPTNEIIRVIRSVASGDLSQEVPLEVEGRKLQGQFLNSAEVVNAMVGQLAIFASEVTRVAREVSTDGKLGGQAEVKGVSGTWKDLTDNVNLMAANLTNQVRNIAEVTTAVARGDLTKKITVDVKGEILELKDTINTMVDQLNGFASEVTRVAREVGADGKLGGQAEVKGVSGTWKDLTDNVNSMAANLTNQVRNIAEVTTAVARGDLTKKITVEAKGEILEVKNTVNTMVDQLGTFASEVTRVAREVGTDGKLGGQAEVEGVGGTWKDLTESVNSMAANLTGQVRNIAQVTTAVAGGDLSKQITVEAKGEILELKNTINTMVDQLGTFAAEVTRVAREVGTEGKLGGQAEVEGVGGTWRDLTESVNSMAANLTGQVRNIAEVTTAVANGDLSRKITVDALGEILELKSTINTMVDQLRSFASEVTRVAREVGTEGKLGGQAEVEGVGGTWRDLTESVNSMAANLTGQVRNIAQVTTAVARGDLSKQITVEAKGEIMELKNTINTMVDQLGTFAAEVTRVAREVGTEGKLGGQAEVEGVGGTWRDLTESVNSMAANLTGQVRNVAEVTTAVANGDLSRKITVDVRGEFLQLKDTINTMVDQLNGFASEVTRVAREVGTDGKLGGQAEVRGVSGTWKDLTDNVNSMAANLTNQVRNIAEVTTAVAGGDLSKKITVDARGEILELKNTINTMVDQLSTFASEVTRVAREVGTDGKLGGQAKVEGVGGTWKDLTDNVNSMAANLTGQVRNIAEVTVAVANGDLSRKITVDVRGEFLQLKETINTMVDQLRSFASEVTRVAREVGTDGKLGGQAYVTGVAGTWKDLTESVNFMAANLTNQVRNIAQVTTAVANGDLSKKITVDAKGEIMELKNTVNTMVDQLNSFASEVTRVAREVGTDGKLGGQAQVRGVSGTWKDLTDNVNSMAANLTNQVRGIAKVVTAVANGDLKRKLTVEAKGEIADLADTINNMIDTLALFADQVTTVAREVGVEGKLGGQANVPGAAGTWKDLTDNVNQLAANLTNQVRAIAEVATAVTKGDLSRSIQVETRGEVSDLKDNINEMIRNLRETTRQNAEQDWLKTNLAKFTRLLQGQRDLMTVSKMILSELAPLVNAQHGVFYAMDESKGDQQLHMLAAYAFKERKNLSDHYRIGEGLVGQCAYEKQRILLTNVPSDYIQINSALGEASPLNIIVLPVVFEGNVRAIVELASFDRFSPTHQAFLDQLAESIGIVLNTIEAGSRTEDLLKQSQSLASELQSQQEELRQTNEELEEKARLLEEQKLEVEQKNREVEQAKQAVEEKASQLALTSKYKSEFLSNMSHELRTPLNSLLILAQQLSDNPDKNLSDKQVNFAKTIQGSGQDLLALINEILDLSKIESGTVTLDLSDVLLTDVRDQVNRTFRHVADSRKLKLDIALAADLPAAIRTDEKRLHQVLKNLLSNAFKFTEKGGVTVAVETATRGWSFDNERLNRARKVFAFRVIDSGIGIPAEKQRIIFEAFQQADGSTSRKYGGTGLGLSISREIARLLGGELRLERSAPGEGSIFVLYIPADGAPNTDNRKKEMPTDAPQMARTGKATKPAKPEQAAKATNSTEPERTAKPAVTDDRGQLQEGRPIVLIVEDDPTFAAILLDTAREGGFQGIVTAHGEEVLDLVRRFKPAAITLDIQLPDVDGWTVLERLKADPGMRHIPVDIITVEEDRIRGLRRGAHQFLIKPLAKETLAAALGTAVKFAARPVRSLLLADGNEKTRDATIKLIGNGDVQIKAVATGKEALAAIKRKAYDCIVLDLKLPDMAGSELIQAVHKNEALRDIPFIFYGDRKPTPEEEELVRNLGMAVVRTASSPERLLDETALFLHRVLAKLPKPKQQMLEKACLSDKSLAGKKALVVDDDIRNVFALTSALERENMEVFPAENGKAAIASLKADPAIDIVLMDVMMPEMDGYATTREIRKIKRFHNLPVIALTAKAMKGDREKCIAAGMSDYISKPVNVEQLLSLMRVWLYR